MTSFQEVTSLILPFLQQSHRSQLCYSSSCSSSQNLTHLSNLGSGNWNTQANNLCPWYSFCYSM